MTTPTDDTCTMCQKVHGVDGWEPKHAPVYAGGGGEQLPRKDTERRIPAGAQMAVSPWPFDPVLRQALIDKGVLTPQDLRDAEEKIRAITSATMGGWGGANRAAEGGAGSVAERD